MREGEASRTAEYMALFRALESARPAGKRLFRDPLAEAFLARRLRLVVALARIPGVERRLVGFIDRRWAGTRTSAVARTRFIDESVCAALADGAAQVVLLGAGFDARAYRLEGIEKTVVFEVDHPDTQARKRRVVRDALGSEPSHVRFVATDFNQRRLEDAMTAAGYDPGARTLFVWEGVSNYLDQTAVDVTLRWCATAAGGSRLIFTYIHRAVLDDPDAFDGTRNLFAMLEASGERWTFGLDPASLAEFLKQRGLRLDHDIGAREYRERYFGEAARAMRGYEFYRIATVLVPRSAGPNVG